MPKLQKREGVHLSVFARTKTWIVSQFYEQAMQELGLDNACKPPYHFVPLQMIANPFCKKSQRNSASSGRMTLSCIRNYA